MSVSQKEKMFFTEHLSLMLRGKTSLIEAIEILKNETKSKTLKKTLDDVLKKVLEGESLHRSLERHSNVFDRFFQSIVRVGEESGTLEENLRYLSICLKSEYSLRRKIIGALIYPILIVITALFVIIAITIFVLPKLLTLFKSLEIKLPLATRILLGSGSFLQKHWAFLLAGTIFLVILYRILRFSKTFGFYFDKIGLALPFFGTISKNHNLARFSRILFTLLKSGMSILEALDICIESMSNQVYKKDLGIVRIGVERGEKISQGLKQVPKTFSAIFAQMVFVGEETGTLEESMLYLAEFYESEVDSAAKGLLSIFEPALLILVGLFVAFVVLAIITPIYQFTSGLNVR